MRLRPAELLIALVACLAALPSSTQARSDDRQQPMAIEADYADATLADDSESILKKVVITQGSLRIEADMATVTRRAGEITRVLLEGKPASLQQQNDNGARMRASAHRIDYDTTSEIVVMTGAVEIDQGADTMRGEKITYNLTDGQLNAGAEGSRIHMTIQPKPAAPKEGGAP
jgi:lipopolysaccharide export system protein LptA